MPVGKHINYFVIVQRNVPMYKQEYQRIESVLAHRMSVNSLNKFQG